MENVPEKHEPKELSLIKVADALFKSQLFPNVRNSFGAYAIVEYGAELDIPPMTSLQTMSIISGKICMAAQMMLTLALKKGVSYKVNTDSDKEVSVTFKRQGFESYTSSFSVEEAKRAGIYKAQGGWEKWPRDMCFWRAVTRGLRRIAPDVILGLYAIEELKDAPPLNEPIESQIMPPDAPKPPDNTNQKPPNAQDAPGQEISGECISEPQRKRFWAIAKSTKATDDQIKEWLFREYDLEHTKDIPKTLYEEICERVKSDLEEKGE